MAGLPFSKRGGDLGLVFLFFMLVVWFEVGRKAGDQRVFMDRILVRIALLISASLEKYILTILMLVTLKMTSFGLAEKKRKLSENWKKNAVIMQGVRKATGRGMTMNVAQQKLRRKLRLMNSRKNWSLRNFKMQYRLILFRHLKRSSSLFVTIESGRALGSRILEFSIKTFLFRDFFGLAPL